MDEAIRIALRVIEERAVLTEKMALDASHAGRAAAATAFDDRAQEYRRHEAVLMDAALKAWSSQ